jgi:septal ring factor EnvC (AmiA/AmiB activator)
MFLVFPLLFVLFFSSVSSGVTPEEEYKKIQEKMSEQKKKLREAQERESSVLNEIEGVNMRLGKIEAELKRYRKNLKRTETEISSVTSEIEKMNVVLAKQKEWLKRKLIIMHKFGYSGDMLVVLMSAGDISQMMRIWKYLENITLYEHKVLGDYRETLTGFNERYERLNVLKAELKTGADRVKTKEQELADQKQSKVLILSSVRKEKASHQRMLAELKEASKRLMDLIEKSSKTDTYGQDRRPLRHPKRSRVLHPRVQERRPYQDADEFRRQVCL